MDDVKGTAVFSEVNPEDDNQCWFYGARHTAANTRNADQATPPRKLEKQKWKRSLFEESLGFFNVYKRQNEALAKCEQEGPMARVFAFEHSIYYPGQRRFLVSTIERFWYWYKEQHGVAFYELIQQDRPARLYFDLEFYRETNPNADEKLLIKDFNDCVGEVLLDMFGVVLNPDQDMLVLDASTSVKFSEHIIIHLTDNYLFPSNIAMKPFIQQLEKKMLSSGRCVVWNADATKMVPLCDVAVYSMNRNFRLYLSSKLGKNNPLVLAARCRFYMHRERPSKKQIFLDSLVVPAMKNSSENVFHISMDENCTETGTTNILKVSAQANTSGDFVDYMTGYGPTSPFPILDQHIIAMNRKWKDNVSIRQWKLSIDKYTRSRRITYYISRCRYCFNIGREHRSNGVYWVVDLDKLHCFQKCFDVDCRGTSSNYFPLPNFVRTSIPTASDLAMASDVTSVQAPNTDTEGTLSEELLFSLVNEAKAVNEVEIQKRMQQCRRRSAAVEMKALKENGNSLELSDEELLKAFAEIEDQPS